MKSLNQHYILATGKAGHSRLRLVHEVYGPITDTLFSKIDVRPGMQVVDIGCGIGSVTLRFAECVGGAGRVTGGDMSIENLAAARKDAETSGLVNVQ